MLQRWYLIKGKPDLLAPNTSSSTRTYFGQRLVPQTAGAIEPHAPRLGVHHVERFEPEEQLHAGPGIERAIAKGSVIVLAKVEADGPDAARALIDAIRKPKASKTASAS